MLGLSFSLQQIQQTKVLICHFTQVHHAKSLLCCIGSYFMQVPLACEVPLISKRKFSILKFFSRSASYYILEDLPCNNQFRAIERTKPSNPRTTAPIYIAWFPTLLSVVPSAHLQTELFFPRQIYGKPIPLFNVLFTVPNNEFIFFFVEREIRSLEIVSNASVVFSKLL